MITLTRIAETFVVRWCKNPAFNFGSYKKARRNANLEVEPACFICRTDFLESDDIALASLVQGGGQGSNELLCQSCAEKAVE